LIASPKPFHIRGSADAAYPPSCVANHHVADFAACQVAVAIETVVRRISKLPRVSKLPVMPGQAIEESKIPVDRLAAACANSYCFRL